MATITHFLALATGMGILFKARKVYPQCRWQSRELARRCW